jgi:hypothetical protein
MVYIRPRMSFFAVATIRFSGTPAVRQVRGKMQPRCDALSILSCKVLPNKTHHCDQKACVNTHTRESRGGREREGEREVKIRLSLISVAPADAGALAGTFKAQDVANSLLVYANICVAPTKSTKSESESESEGESKSETVLFFRLATSEPTSLPNILER